MKSRPGGYEGRKEVKMTRLELLYKVKAGYMDALETLIKYELEKADKKATTADMLAAVKRILKQGAVRYGARNDRSAKIAIDNTTYIYSPYTFIVTDKMFDSIPEGNAEQARTASNFMKFVETAKGNEGAELELPTIAELKACISEQKAKGEKYPLYDFGEGLPCVNAEYLKDILILIPKARATASTQTLKPIYFAGDGYNNYGILCPVHKG